MRGSIPNFRRLYGSQPLHLLILIAGFALLVYVLITMKPATLWNPRVWWQSIVVWFAAAIIIHDLVLFPIYALVDRVLQLSERKRPDRRVPVVNYLRVPALGSGLLLLVFFPGLVEQGAHTYITATGQTQAPFLGRWLLLTAGMFVISALAYAVRLMTADRRVTAPPE
jgi:hypothetical protein